ncbi:hypothetical protein [Ignavibacterium sp.]|uniref:hypothetical protein n=1 Tax=Ignavibacterium sp. TaxID=2651167 RepID=UPI00261A5C26|nr:hypothetical protein [Ignavibacterium sp.]
MPRSSERGQNVNSNYMDFSPNTFIDYWAKAKSIFWNYIFTGRNAGAIRSIN